MRIAIIGAGISGLTAGRELVKEGHEVVVFEKSRGYGGRVSTRYAGEDLNLRLDHGVPYLSGESAEFQSFLLELLDEDIIKPWIGSEMVYQKGDMIHVKHDEPVSVATEGMNTIGRYLGRNLDVQLGTRVGGLTFIGDDRRKKRAWMLNFESSDTYEADAVIIATPSKQAYSVLSTTIDEVSTLKMVREIDDVEYDPLFVLMAGYTNQVMPEWNSLQVYNKDIGWISNEASKRENASALVMHSTVEYAIENIETDKEKVKQHLLEVAGDVLGEWAVQPEWSQVHFWRYYKAKNPLPYPYIDLMETEKPLALVGSYMNGSTVESAYLSGLKLAQHWKDQLV